MLNIQNLVKTYKNGHRAVDDLTLAVAPGDICGFIGPNGAGKTTTIKCVTGIQDFDRGHITIGGHDVTREPVEAKMLTAYIPDNPDLYDSMTGMKYLSFIADIYRVGKEERDRLIQKYADAFEITRNLGDVISSYSHGMKQKLALISALIHSPKLLILDEPFVGLDPKASFTLKEVMRELCAGGTAIFFSTHVLEVAEKLCNKIAIIKNGKLIAFGPIDDVRGDASLETFFLELTDTDAAGK